MTLPDTCSCGQPSGHRSGLRLSPAEMGMLRDVLGRLAGCPRCSGESPNVCTCLEPCCFVDCAGKEASDADLPG
jgi:hypothetical protein